MSANSFKAFTKIVDTLLARDDSGPFTKPVDWQSLGLWDYPKVITNFMDLGTVRSNLSQNNYDTLEAAANDVRQVFKNCCKYNDEGTDFYQLGESFSIRFEEMYKRLSRTTVGSSSPSSSSPSGGYSQLFQSSPYGRPSRSAGRPPLEARKSFSHNLFKITGDELGHVVTVLDQKCPKALTAVAGDQGTGAEAAGGGKGGGGGGGGGAGRDGGKDEEPNVEIVIDEIDDEVFWELKEFVDNKIERRKGSKRKR
ncbi:hypothetical protein TrCOL_g11524 [Triparma columacea]|uniref:Bromo domain-containing protein n=1 Tax=Triparma columacea TaxID=722753 RepID=A0A9W7GNU6_9STRA|nr:hypothetical protein TrCOL_g11524 [Triparma columacea]